MNDDSGSEINFFRQAPTGDWPFFSVAKWENVATSCDILVASAKFLVALPTRKAQFPTLWFRVHYIPRNECSMKYFGINPEVLVMFSAGRRLFFTGDQSFLNWASLQKKLSSSGSNQAGKIIFTTEGYWGLCWLSSSCPAHCPIQIQVASLLCPPLCCFVFFSFYE